MVRERGKGWGGGERVRTTEAMEAALTHSGQLRIVVPGNSLQIFCVETVTVQLAMVPVEALFDAILVAVQGVQQSICVCLSASGPDDDIKTLAQLGEELVQMRPARDPLVRFKKCGVDQRLVHVEHECRAEV